MGNEPLPHDPDQELTFRPGNQAGWTLPLEGDARCSQFGHEISALLEMTNGLLVGYCERCDDRFEMPWLIGGTVTTLARSMANEALTFTSPSPSVLQDLGHVAGLLKTDLTELCIAMDQVKAAADFVDGKLRQ